MCAWLCTQLIGAELGAKVAPEKAWVGKVLYKIRAQDCLVWSLCTTVIMALEIMPSLDCPCLAQPSSDLAVVWQISILVIFIMADVCWYNLC